PRRGGDSRRTPRRRSRGQPGPTGRKGGLMNGSPTRLEHDWFPGLVPANVRAGSDAYFDTSYSFGLFGSEMDPGLEMGDASGAYDRTAFLVGSEGRVIVGSY